MTALEKRFLKKARLLLDEVRHRLREPGIPERRRQRLTRDRAACEAHIARIEVCIDRAWANFTRNTGITREACENPPLDYGPIEAPQRKSTCSLLGCRSVCVCAPVDDNGARDHPNCGAERDDPDFDDARSCATALSECVDRAVTTARAHVDGNAAPHANFDDDSATTTPMTTGKGTCPSIGSRVGGESTSASPGQTGEQELLFEPQPNLGLGVNTLPSRGDVTSAEATICVPVEGKNVEGEDVDEKPAEPIRENAPQRIGRTAARNAAKKAKRAAAAATAAFATLPPK